MPRKKTGAVTGTTSSIKFAAILAFFRTQPMEIVKFSQELVNDAVREREAKGKAVLAGRAKGGPASATETVNAATGSALANAGTAASGPVGVVKEKRKPGPQKGYKKGQKAGAGGTSAAGGGQDQPASPTTDSANDASDGGEVTSAEQLPPQEGVLDLDAPK